MAARKMPLTDQGGSVGADRRRLQACSYLKGRAHIIIILRSSVIGGGGEPLIGGSELNGL